MHRINTQQVEKNVALQRAVDAQRRDLQSFAIDNAKMLSAAKAQAQIENRRRATQQQICKTEAEYEERVQREDYERRLRNRTIAQNQDLASELDKQELEQERQAREIQRICEESPELQELEKALKQAYLNKERAVQCQERITQANRERERIQAMEDQMEADRLRAIRADADKIKAKKEQYTEQRVVLQRQIHEREEYLRDMERQKERDREMVDDIVSRINAEDAAEYKKHKEMQEAAARMIKAFEAQRQRELAAAKEAARREEEEIRAYNKAMDDRSMGVEAKKQAKRDEEARIFEKIAEETARKRREEEEFNALRDMLWEEELELKRAQDAKDRQHRQYQMRKDMMDANSRMLVQKEAMRKDELENEARMVALMRRKFAEDEAKERAEEMARKERRSQYMLEVDQQKVEKRNMYDSERAKETAAAEEALRREEYRKNVIREARKRLILEHSMRLKAFLPQKLISNEDEFDAYRQGISQYDDQREY